LEKNFKISCWVSKCSWMDLMNWKSKNVVAYIWLTTMIHSPPRFRSSLYTINEPSTAATCSRSSPRILKTIKVKYICTSIILTTYIYIYSYYNSDVSADVHFQNHGQYNYNEYWKYSMEAGLCKLMPYNWVILTIIFVKNWIV